MNKQNVGALAAILSAALISGAHAALPIEFSDSGIAVADVVALLVASLGVFAAWLAFKYVMKAIKGAKA